MDPTEIHVVFVTTPQDQAHTIAAALVERRVAACVNILDTVRSTYRWEGQIQTDPEALLIIKTHQSKLDLLRDSVLELHPYDLPEVLALPSVGGHIPYLQWVKTEVKEP